MLRLSFLVLFVCLAGFTAAQNLCNLRFDPKKPGIFVSKFGSNRLFTNAKTGSITFDDKLDGYCSTGFQALSYSTTTVYKEVTFVCSSGSVYFQAPGSTSNIQVRNDGYLACDSGSQYYEEKLDHCNDYGLAYGFNVAKTPVVIADVCYNLATMQPNFVHYIAGIRSSVIEQQSSFNPSNVTTPLASTRDVLFDTTTITKEKTALAAAIKATMPDYVNIIDYQLGELVPIEAFAGPLDPYVSSFVATNMVPWWQPLKYGNWKEVENAIENLSIQGTYDVYAGTSDDVTYHYTGKCFFTEPLTYKVDQYVRSVPLYVWNLIKRRNSNDTGVVIIGVNSPFFEGASTTDALCKDVCDSIPWLGVVNKIRHMAALGYVFCCAPKEVEGRLNGFPTSY